MDVENLAKELILKNMTPEQQMAVLDSVRQSVLQAKEVQKKKIGENVDLVVQALKKIEADIRSRFDDVGNAIEKRVASIQDGRDGTNGKDGRDGKDGKSGRDGSKGDKGDAGRDGRDGVDGTDGISVTSARIDFDGSLVITLSSGVELNVGEVVAPDLAERIKVITNGGGTSQSVLDTLASLQTQITNLIPSQTGNSGKYLTTNGTATSWASIAGGGLSYQGTWNAFTNTPTLTSSSGVNGYYYITATAGSTNLDGITDWQIGDWLLFNGSVWQKIDQSNLVTSVNGQTGAVSVGTVTSVSALTLGTSGTDLSSTVANGTTTPVITLNVPTASATNRGALSSADWTTFNNKGSGTVTSVTGTSPVASSGGATPAISLAASYGDTQNPYASKTANFVLAAPNGSAGAPTFRAIVASDIPTLNQNTTGSAATLTTTRAIYGNNFDGSAALTQVIASTYGGTGNGFTKFTGATTAERTYTLPDATTTILTTNAAVTIGQGGTGQTTAAAAFDALAPSQATNSGKYLTTNGTTTSWGTVSAGLSISDDTSTSAVRYLTFTSATTGTITSENVSSTKLQYTPSTGKLDIGGEIRNFTSADSSPYTQARITVYGGAGVDTTNWGYFGYGSDGSMRIVYAKTGTGAPLLFGTSSAIDNTGTFAAQAGITPAGVFSFNSGYGSSAAAYGCRAWVNFNGTGTVAIRGSGNVSSITDNGGTGNYTVNFTTAMPDANYSVGGTAGYDDAASMGTVNPKVFNTGSMRFVTNPANGSTSDYHFISVQIFR
jgi:hypothetical protein